MIQLLAGMKLPETGLTENDSDTEFRKRVIFTNRIALVLALAALIGFFANFLFLYLNERDFSWLNAFRPLLLSSVMLFILVFNYFRLFKAGKLILIFSPIIVLNFLPLFTGKINAELALSSPVVTLTVSAVIYLIFNIKEERFLYYLSLFFLFFVLVFFEPALIFFSDTDEAVFELIHKHIFAYTTFKVAGFITVNAVLYYVMKMNSRIHNEMLSVQNDLLEINYEVTSKSIKLSEYHEELKAQNSELHVQNEHIAMQRDFTQELSDKLAEKNQQLTESIHYAKNIQDAVFPQKKLFKDLANDCFIMLRPRDVITGDFKWSGKVGDKVVIAAADCTGHGIPGALLSILAVTLLNDIVLKEYCTEANLILDRLRERMIEALSQSSGEDNTGDGLDICLCVFDFADKCLMYAGANSPLLQVRDFKMVEFKPDRMPIGKYETDAVPFSVQKIEIKKGDRFYLFSDGYRDQFGGKTNKKLKKRIFKDLLLSTSGNKLSAQHEILENFFDDWKGSNEQTDDVLLIGIEV
jgi:serine phosphatase RsbU (regulator of sigma subunit)